MLSLLYITIYNCTNLHEFQVTIYIADNTNVSRKSVLLECIYKWQQKLRLDNNCSIRVYQSFVKNISYYAGIMFNAFSITYYAHNIMLA